MTSGTHIPFLGVSELHSFAQLPQLFRFAAPAMEAICMGCKDSSCSFEPLRLKRRELNDLDVLLDGKGHGPLEAHLGKSGNLGLSWSWTRSQYSSGWWWLEHGFYDFPIYWDFHHPNWRSHIFQRDWNHQSFAYGQGMEGAEKHLEEQRGF